MNKTAQGIRYALFRISDSRNEQAARTGISTTSLRSYELGITSPSFDRLRRIAVAADVSIDWIVNGGRDNPED